MLVHVQNCLLGSYLSSYIVKQRILYDQFLYSHEDSSLEVLLPIDKPETRLSTRFAVHIAFHM